MPAGPVSTAVLRDAATVALLRDGTSGLQVFLMRRPATMRFAAGMYVFPGGAVEPGDRDLPLLDDAALVPLADRAATATPRSLLAAAVRETFEECGVLLAVPGGPVPAPLTAERVALTEGRLGLGELLTAHRLAVDPGALPLVGHWVTPELGTHRYDTRFFLAAMPPDQQASDVSPETEGSAWWEPAAAVAAHRAGELAMLPPTLATLGWLATQRTVAVALLAAPTLRVRPLLPQRRPDPDGRTRWVLTDARTGERLTPADTGVTADSSEADVLGGVAEIHDASGRLA